MKYATSHFSKQSRGSRATADKSLGSRTSRQRSLSPNRRQTLGVQQEVDSEEDQQGVDEEMDEEAENIANMDSSMTKSAREKMILSACGIQFGKEESVERIDAPPLLLGVDLVTESTTTAESTVQEDWVADAIFNVPLSSKTWERFRPLGLLGIGERLSSIDGTIEYFMEMLQDN